MAGIRSGISEQSTYRAKITHAPILDREIRLEVAEAVGTRISKNAPRGSDLRSPAFAASMIVAMMMIAGAFVGFSMQTPRASAYSTHGPIYIANDLDFTLVNGVVSGNGTALDPYIIAGWEIQPGFSEGIYITGTTAYFVISDVYIHGTGVSNGIHFSYLAHGSIVNSTLNTNQVGIRLDDSNDITVANNNIDDQSDVGVRLDYSHDVRIINNTMNRDAYGVYAGYDVRDIFIIDNTMDETDYGGLYVEGSALRYTVVGNLMRNNNWGYGIVLDGAATDNYLADNNLSDNVDGGISITDVATTNIIRNNTVINSSTGYGIYLQQGDGNLIENNTVAGIRDDAIYMGAQVSTGLNIIANNTVSDNLDIGISTNYGNGYIIVNNTIEANAGGGLNFLGNFATIAGNILTDNPKFGMSLGVASGYNDIVNNTFVNDGLFARFLNAEGNDISSNTVNGKTLVFLEHVNGYTVPNAGQVIAKDCSDITVTGLNLSKATVGVELWHSVDCTIQGIISTGNQYGLYMENWSTGNDITLCNLSANSIGVYIGTQSHNITIVRNTISGNAASGVEIGTSDSTTIMGNDLIGNVAAVQASQCQRTIVQSNQIKDGGSYGVSILYCSNVTVQTNDFVNAGMYGVNLYSSSYCRIEDNQVDAGTYGIYAAWSSKYNVIEDNNIYGNQNGVYLTSFGASYLCEWNNITGNTITGNSADGIYLRYAKHNTITWNNVTGNARGIHVNSTSATSNWIYLNNFTGNTVNARSDDATHSNWWNTSKMMTYNYSGSTFVGYLGNRYGDYSGPDANGDGVGDTPYVLGQEQDNYPLIEVPTEIIPEFPALILPLVAMALMFAAFGSAHARKKKS